MVCVRDDGAPEAWTTGRRIWGGRERRGRYRSKYAREQEDAQRSGRCRDKFASEQAFGGTGGSLRCHDGGGRNGRNL